MTDRRAAHRAQAAARLTALRARTAARLAALQARRKRPERRRTWPWLLPLLLLLLLFCASPPVAVEPPVVAAPPPGGVAAELPEPTPPLPPPAPIRKIARPRAPAPTPPHAPWLDALRLQVAARSQRLAACFEGAANPGQIKWTTTVEPRDGTVSEHELTPMLRTEPLTAVQRDCLIGVLRSPPYRLPTERAPDAPARVGLVIEF